MMKKLKTTILLYMLLSMLVTTASAQDIEVTNEDGVTIYYVRLPTSNYTEVIVSYRGSSWDSYSNEYSGNVVIPDSVTYNGKTYRVTSIGNSAFSDCPGLTSVTIPNSVTSIDGCAFSKCSGLTSVTIPNSVTIIGSSAFSDCTGLTSVTIPNSVTSIGSSAFSGSTGLTSIAIPKSVTSINYNAFSDCSSLTSVTIPNSVTSIGYRAFSGCTGLKEVYYNATNCTSMGTSSNHVFEGCNSLTTLHIGDNVQKIPAYAFYGCTGLTSVTIPNSVTSIGKRAFSGCTGLKEVNYNATNCTSKEIFEGCNSLTTLHIGKNVQNIPAYAFWGCTGLTSVNIPNSVTSIGESAFQDCSQLESVVFGTGLLTIGSYIFSGHTPAKVFWLANTPPSGYGNAAGTVNYVVNDQYISLRNNTVYLFLSSLFEVDGIKYVPISQSDLTCEIIECANENDIVVQESITYNGTTYIVKGIGNYAFYGCTDLKSVFIPNSVTNIGGSAFYNCSGLTSVTIPSSVTNIGAKAFYGCSGLTEVNYNATNCNSMGSSSSSIFQDCESLATLHIGENVQIIPDYAFRGCTGLTSVTISNSVTSIGIDAFKDCTGLTSVTIGNSVESIGDWAFFGCSSLASVTIPNSVTSIGSYAFSGCSSLGSVTIPKSVTSIGSGAFQNCTDLTSVVVESETPVGIYSNTFYGSQENATLYVPYGSKAVYETTDYWKDFKEIVEMNPKCATPTITFANGKLTFDCETEDVKFVYNISMSGEHAGTGSEVFLANTTTTYTVSVYSTKEGCENSDVATMDIDLKALSGDVNNDGEITISDAVAIVEIILNSISEPEPKFYYSVGTEEVTADNYTTANGAQYKSSLAEIPETLDLSAISQQQAVILLPEGCLPMIRGASGLVGTTSVSLGNGYMVYTTTSAINGSECTCTVYK